MSRMTMLWNFLPLEMRAAGYNYVRSIGLKWALRGVKTARGVTVLVVSTLILLLITSLSIFQVINFLFASIDSGVEIGAWRWGSASFIGWAVLAAISAGLLAYSMSSRAWLKASGLLQPIKETLYATAHGPLYQHYQTQPTHSQSAVPPELPLLLRDFETRLERRLETWWSTKVAEQELRETVRQSVARNESQFGQSEPYQPRH